MRGRGIVFSIREVSPCKGCTEKFESCHSRCPKDQRGEQGYETWLQEVERVKVQRKQYEDNLRNYKWRVE